MTRAGRSGSFLGPWFLSLPLLLTTAMALPALAQAPQPDAAQESALPSVGEILKFVVDRAASERWIIRRAALQHFSERGVWPRSMSALIAAGYLDEDFSLILEIGGEFTFVADDETFQVDLELPVVADLLDFAEDGTLRLPPHSTLFAPRSVTDGAEPEPGVDALADEAPATFLARSPGHDRFWDKVANRLLVTRDLEYLQAVRAKEDIDRDPVDTLLVDAPKPSDEDLAIEFDKLAVVFQSVSGTTFAGGVEAPRLFDDRDVRFGANPDGKSAFSSVALSRFYDSAAPELSVALSGQSRFATLRAERVALDSATIDEADIVVLNGSAPVTRGQLDSVAVTQLTAGSNMVLSVSADFAVLFEQAVGPVFLGVSRDPVFDGLTIRDRLDVGTALDSGTALSVTSDAVDAMRVEGNVLVRGDATRVEGDVRVIGRLLHAKEPTDTLSNPAFMFEGRDYFAPTGVRSLGDIEARTGQIWIGNELTRGLSLDIDGVSLFASAADARRFSFRPNGESRRVIELFEQGGALNILARGGSDLVLGAESGRSVFRLGRESVAGDPLRYAFQDVSGEDAVVISDGRVGINLQERLIDSYGEVPTKPSPTVPTVVVEGVIIAENLAVGTPGNLQGKSGPAQRLLLENLVAGEVSGEGDVVFNTSPTTSGGPFGFEFAVDDRLIAYLGGSSGNLSIGNRLSNGLLSVGSANADAFYVDADGDVSSTGTLTVNGDAVLGSDAASSLTVHAQSLLGLVRIKNAKLVVSDDVGADGAVVRLLGDSRNRAALEVSDTRTRGLGAGPDPAPLRIVRASDGMLLSAGGSGSAAALGLASFERFSQFPGNTSVPFGSLALDRATTRHYLYLRDGWSQVIIGDSACLALSGSDCNVSEFLIGGNSFTATAQLGTVGAQPLELITNNVRAVTIDSSQQITVHESVFFQAPGSVSVDRPAVDASSGAMTWSAAMIRLTSTGTVAFGSMTERSGMLEIRTTDTLTLNGDVRVSAVSPSTRSLSAGNVQMDGDVRLGVVGGTVRVPAIVKAGDSGLRFCDDAGRQCKHLQQPNTAVAGTSVRLELTSSDQSGQLLATEISGSSITTTLPGTGGLLISDPGGLADLEPGVDFKGETVFMGPTTVRELGVFEPPDATTPLIIVRDGDGPIFSARFNGGAAVSNIYLVSSSSAFTSNCPSGVSCVNQHPDSGSLVLVQELSGSSSGAYLYRPASRRLVRMAVSTPTGAINNDDLDSGRGAPLVIGTVDAQPLRLISNSAVGINIGLTETQILFDATALEGLSGSQATVGEQGIASVMGRTVLNGDVVAASDALLRFNGVIQGSGGILAVFSSTGTRSLTLASATSGEPERAFTLGAFPFLPGEDPVRLVTASDVDWVGPGMFAPLSVTADKMSITPGSVTSTQLAAGAVRGDDIFGGTIVAEDLADGAVLPRHLSASAFGTFLASEAIVRRHFLDGTIQNDDIDDDTITGDQLAFSLSDLCQELGGACVDSAGDLENDAITTAKIDTGTITGRHIDVGAVTSDKIDTGTITSADIAPGTVISTTLADGAVGPRALAVAAVGVEHFSDGAVAAVARAVLSPGAVGAEQLAQDAVGPGHIADGAVGAEQLAEDAVGNRQLVAGERYDRITRVGRLEGLEVDGPIHAALPLASATGATLCLSGSAISQCSSLAALKTAVRPLDLGLETVLALRPRRFAWLGDGREDLGFLAEEVAAVDPLLAATDAEGRLVGVRYRQMSALLARAVQQQNEALGPLSEALAASDGHVGVGKAAHPDYRLDVAGTARAGLFVETSDRRLKRDVRPLSGAESLAALASVPGVRYRWNAEYRRLRPGAERRWQVGVIAQDVARALPDLVRQGADGYLTVSYDRFVPHLVGAVNALSARLDGLRGALASVPGGLELRRPLRAGGRVALSPEGDVRARSLAVDADMRVGDRFALRRSSTLASLLRVDAERRADTEVEGYLSARDVYLADRGAWWSSLDSKVQLADQPPLAWECDSDAVKGALRLVTSSNNLYVCGGADGWWARPMRPASGDVVGGIGLL